MGGRDEGGGRVGTQGVRHGDRCLASDDCAGTAHPTLQGRWFRVGTRLLTYFWVGASLPPWGDQARHLLID